VPLNNLIYLGFQSSRFPLNDAQLRTALAACVDRAALLGEAFGGYARGTETPFPPEWGRVSQKEFARPFDAAAAKKQLEALGYNELNRDGVRMKRYGRALRFTLLVNKDSSYKMKAAQALKRQLAAFQITIELNALPFADYQRAVKNWNFDLYLGELRLTPDLDLSPLLLSGGAVTQGVSVWGKTSTAYGQMLQELLTPAQFCAVFNSETPFLPLGYRDGLALLSRALRAIPDCRPENLFANLDNWKE
jgi:peptide/nickel transport system substrate-binding protein